MKRNLSAAKSMVNRRTRAVPPGPRSLYGVGVATDVGQIQGIMRGLVGASKLNFIADQLVARAGAFGPAKPPPVGDSRLRDEEDLPRFRAEMVRVASGYYETIDPDDKVVLSALQRETRSVKRVPITTKEMAIAEIRGYRQELEFQRGQSTIRNYPQPGSPLAQKLEQIETSRKRLDKAKTKARKRRQNRR